MRELLGHPKDMMATTKSETTIVNAIKTSYIMLQLRMECVSDIRNYILGDGTKWVISSQAYSRAKKVVINATRVNTLLNFDLPKCGAKQSGWQFAYHVSKNGQSSIAKRTENFFVKVIGYEQGTTAQKNLNVQKPQVENIGVGNSKRIEKQSTPHTVENVHVAEKIISSFLLSIMSKVMDISNANVANIQMVRNSMITSLSKDAQIIISCFVTTAIWVEHVIMEYALIGKVQRLSLRRVRSSDRMCALPLWGKDIVPSA